MTFYYQSSSFSDPPKPTTDQLKLWKYLVDKSNWRIVQLPNGYYQTEYEDMLNEDVWIDVTRRSTINGAEDTINSAIAHYLERLEFAKGPKVVKTFKK